MVSRNLGHTFPRLELASVKIDELNMRGLILLLILCFFKSFSLSDEVDRDGKGTKIFPLQRLRRNSDENFP